eukprot:gnl/Hemi2/17514_TR5790_c0_g1_i1.p1 gnl/Hemi2/17514_TR5790_c0_g1~~gnl/Hemi2/17514_TR5790_c0_g1_i1.p1  ORF type:complete len:847 (-),score=267.78 gnl/Hemi2/17514_TR5790_c0_g1_i1:87-2582(-)
MAVRGLLLAAVVCLFLASFAIVVCESVTVGRVVRNEKSVRTSVRGWDVVSRAADSDRVNLLFGLKNQNMDKLKAIVDKTSDIRSPSYGTRLSHNDLTQLIAPSKESISQVTKWLEEHGLTTNDYLIHRGQDFITAKMPVSTARAMLETDFHHFVHKTSGARVLRAMNGRYTLPTDVHPHIDVIGGLGHFPAPQKSNARRTKDRVKQALRSSTRPSAAATPDATATPTAPTPAAADAASVGYPSLSVLDIQAADGQISFIWTVTCADGSNPDSFPFCEGTSLPLTSVTFTVVQGGLSAQMQAVPSSKTCPMMASVGQLVCSTTVSGLQNFVSVMPSASANFTGTMSNFNLPAKHIGIYPTHIAVPANLHAYYNIPMGARALNPQSSQALIEFNQEGFLMSDLRKFVSAFGIQDSSDVSTIGDFASQDIGEGSLDVQYIIAVAPGASTTYMSVSPTEGDGFLLQYAADVSSLENPPFVHSISWGMAESQATDPDYVTRVNDEFVKMAARGITIVVSSGDNGIRADASDNCDAFEPAFPASAPYVVSVGATQFSTSPSPSCSMTSEFGPSIASSVMGEIACSTSTGALISSGGGFSNTFTTPSFQVFEVSRYLTNMTSILPPVELFNPQGRGYPDVSAAGHSYIEVAEGEFSFVDGTSASAPLFAGMLSLLNDYLLSEHGKTLGYVTPLLYQMAHTYPACFNDVVLGNNACGETIVSFEPNCCEYGFSASTGWDPVTGLGSPNFEAMLAFLKQQKFDASVSDDSSKANTGVVLGSVALALAGVTIICLVVYLVWVTYLKKPQSTDSHLALLKTPTSYPQQQQQQAPQSGYTPLV